MPIDYRVPNRTVTIPLVLKPVGATSFDTIRRPPSSCTDAASAMDDEPPPALGAVIEEGRGSLPFALIHGEALVACAGVTLKAVATALQIGCT